MVRAHFATSGHWPRHPGIRPAPTDHRTNAPPLDYAPRTTDQVVNIAESREIPHVFAWSTSWPTSPPRSFRHYLIGSWNLIRSRYRSGSFVLRHGGPPSTLGPLWPLDPFSGWSTSLNPAKSGTFSLVNIVATFARMSPVHLPRSALCVAPLHHTTTVWVCAGGATGWSGRRKPKIFRVMRPMSSKSV